MDLNEWFHTERIFKICFFLRTDSKTYQVWQRTLCIIPSRETNISLNSNVPSPGPDSKIANITQPPPGPCVPSKLCTWRIDWSGSSGAEPWFGISSVNPTDLLSAQLATTVNYCVSRGLTRYMDYVTQISETSSRMSKLDKQIHIMYLRWTNPRPSSTECDK